MLQWLLSQWLHQAVKQKIMDAALVAAQESLSSVSDTRSDPQPRPEPPRPRPEIALLFGSHLEATGVIDAALDLVGVQRTSYVERAGGWCGRPIVVAETGLGRLAAARAAAELIHRHQPKWVVAAGFAAALTPSVKVGNILLADVIRDLHGSELAVGFRLDPEVLKKSRKLKVGTLLTLDDVVRTRAEKRDLHESYGALACDLESAAIAEVCRQEKTRFLSVRIISDSADAELSPHAERLPLKKPKTYARQLGRWVGRLLNQPDQIPELVARRADAISLADRLAKFLAGVLPQLD